MYLVNLAACMAESNELFCESFAQYLKESSRTDELGQESHGRSANGFSRRVMRFVAANRFAGLILKSGPDSSNECYILGRGGKAGHEEFGGAESAGVKSGRP